MHYCSFERNQVLSKVLRNENKDIKDWDGLGAPRPVRSFQWASGKVIQPVAQCRSMHLKFVRGRWRGGCFEREECLAKG